MRKILVVWFLILTIQAHKSDVVCSDSVCSFVVVLVLHLQTDKKNFSYLAGIYVLFRPFFNFKNNFLFCVLARLPQLYLIINIDSENT